MADTYKADVRLLQFKFLSDEPSQYVIRFKFEDGTEFDLPVSEDEYWRLKVAIEGE